MMPSPGLRRNELKHSQRFRCHPHQEAKPRPAAADHDQNVIAWVPRRRY